LCWDALWGSQLNERDYTDGRKRSTTTTMMI
jgi:hypothetical protein